MLVFLNFIKNPKNWNIILFVLILGLIGLFFWQKSRTQHFKFQYESQIKETKRVQNNYDASLDSIKSYKDKNGNLVGQISSFELKNKDLKIYGEKYFSLWTKEKNKETKTIIQTEYVVVNNIETGTIVNDSTISYKYDTNYNDGNKFSIEGKIPYYISQHIKKGKPIEYSYNEAVLYCYDLQTRGLPDSRVVAFNKQQQIITKEKSFQDTTSFYRIYLTQDVNDIKDEISIKSELNKDYIDVIFKNGVYTYYTGVFVPNKDIESLVETKFTYPKLWTGNNTLKTQDIMTLMTGVYKDKKTGKLMIEVKTNHPGVTFNTIRGAEILSDDKKVSRGIRKEFGIGLNLGIGGMLTPTNNNWSIKYGPVISLGLNYTPRWSQFGPSSKSLEK